jgi:hypothetical protein
VVESFACGIALCSLALGFSAFLVPGMVFVPPGSFLDQGADCFIATIAIYSFLSFFPAQLLLEN